MTNPHIIFKSIEGKIKAGVVELPDIKDICKGGCESESYCFDSCSKHVEAIKQALANPIFFKEEKDAIEIRTLLVRQEELKNENWDFELNKPYKIEGVEIKEESIKEKIEGLGGNGLATTIKQFAFIKKGVFDTGARLPEQKEEVKGWEHYPEAFQLSNYNKEESQSELWNEFHDNFFRKGFEFVKSKFTIKRR